MAELKITLKRSIIGRPQNQRDTVKALGLTKLNSTVENLLMMQSKAWSTLFLT